MGLVFLADDALDVKAEVLLLPYVGEEIETFSGRQLESNDKENFHTAIYFNCNRNLSWNLYEVLSEYSKCQSFLIPYSYIKALGYTMDRAYNDLLGTLLESSSECMLYVALGSCFKVNEKSFYNEILKIEDKIDPAFRCKNGIIKKEEIRMYSSSFKSFMEDTKNKYKYLNANDELLEGDYTSLEDEKKIEAEFDADLERFISTSEFNKMNFVKKDDSLKLKPEPNEITKNELRKMLSSLLNDIDASTGDQKKFFMEKATYLLNKIFLLTKESEALLDNESTYATTVGRFIRNRIENKMGYGAKAFRKVITNKQIEVNVITKKKIEDYENERTHCTKLTIYTVSLFLELNLTQMLQLMTLAGYGFSPLDNVDRIFSDYYLEKSNPSLPGFYDFITDKSKGVKWLAECRDCLEQMNFDAINQEVE